MEQDMLRSPPPPSGPRPLQSALPSHRTATLGAPGPSPEATGGQTNLGADGTPRTARGPAAPASQMPRASTSGAAELGPAEQSALAAALGAPGLSPEATGSNANWNVAGSTGAHTQAASSTPPPRPPQATTPGAPGLSPGATGGHNAAAVASGFIPGAPGLSPEATGCPNTAAAASGAPGLSPEATVGLPTSYFPCWGSLTALREPGGSDLFAARLLQLNVSHKWQWFIRVDPVDIFAKVTTPPPEYADA